MSFDLLSKLSLTLALLAAAGQEVGAQARARSLSTGGRVAEVRPRARGGEAVWVDGRPVWPAPAGFGTPEIASPLVWSKKSDAVAFLAREPGGFLFLVVSVVDGAGPPASMAWLMPASALPLHAVTWLGERRVAAGPVALQPRVVASFAIK